MFHVKLRQKKHFPLSGASRQLSPTGASHEKEKTAELPAVFLFRIWLCDYLMLVMGVMAR